MLKVGITGGIGSGKTTVCKVFELLGIPVFYADTVAKSIMLTDFQLKTDIVKTFGEQSYFADGQLNRAHISSIVFKDEEQLSRLNALVHPAVFRAFESWAEENINSPYVLKEAALLFESESYKLCDYTILISSPEASRIQRVMKRDHVSKEEVILRMKRQMSDGEKLKMANYHLLNDEQDLLIPQIIELHKQFLKMGSRS